MSFACCDPVCRYLYLSHSSINCRPCRINVHHMFGTLHFRMALAYNYGRVGDPSSAGVAALWQWHRCNDRSTEWHSAGQCGRTISLHLETMDTSRLLPGQMSFQRLHIIAFTMQRIHLLVWFLFNYKRWHKPIDSTLSTRWSGDLLCSGRLFQLQFAPRGAYCARLCRSTFSAANKSNQTCGKSTLSRGQERGGVHCGSTYTKKAK